MHRVIAPSEFVKGVQAQIWSWALSLDALWVLRIAGTLEKCHRDGALPEGAPGGLTDPGRDWGAAAEAHKQCREGDSSGGFLEQVRLQLKPGWRA